jgi:restriction endonuclease Mrr
MPLSSSSPPLYPDMKRELKQNLLALSARGFEFFAGELLVYIGLEAVTVTRYVGDGGIDALGDLMAGRFRIPTGIQVKRHRNNVQRPDIDKFVGALSGRFSQGLFLTTADYAPAALQKGVCQVFCVNPRKLIEETVQQTRWKNSSKQLSSCEWAWSTSS